MTLAQKSNEPEQHRQAGPAPASYRRILVGLLFGATLGGAVNAGWGASPSVVWLVESLVEPLGRVFLRLIFMIVVPLLLSALSLGVLGLGDLRSIGRIGVRTLLLTVLISGLAVVTGIVLVNLFQPGAGIPPEARMALSGPVTQAPAPPAETTVGLSALLRVVPDNPVRAAAQGDMLAVMFFALVFGIGLARAQDEKVRPLVAVLEGVYEVTMQIVAMVMRLAPYGVACLMFSLTARLGFGVLRQLAGFVGVVLLGLAVHQLVTYSLLLRFAAGISPRAFFRRARLVMATAFSTSSSNATLPVTLQVATERLGIPRDIGSFVLTLGSTANQNGTALFEGVTVLFLAQFFGVELTWSQQLLVVLMAVLAGVGTAGVPGGSLPMIVPVLVTVGVPAEGIGVILGVDRLLDMCRTVLNVTGDLTAAAVVAAWEGRLGFGPEHDQGGDKQLGRSTRGHQSEPHKPTQGGRDGRVLLSSRGQ